jgi:hypothetical protein
VPFFRIIKHLLPTGIAWRVLKTAGRAIERFFEGLAGLPQDIRTFIDLVYLDLFPSTTRQLAEWENQFALEATGSETHRRLRLAAEWKAHGGQSPHYLQGIVQAAGFDVFIHEWWSSGPPYIARDPRDYTTQPTIGTVQCAPPDLNQWQCCSGGPGQAQCNRFLGNETHYLVNDLLNREAPPRVPDDPRYWPYFLYWGGETFPDHATVPATRRAEFEQLLLKLCPAQKWLVLLVDYDLEEIVHDIDGGPIVDDIDDGPIVDDV